MPQVEMVTLVEEEPVKEEKKPRALSKEEEEIEEYYRLQEVHDSQYHKIDLLVSNGGIGIIKKPDEFKPSR